MRAKVLDGRALAEKTYVDIVKRVQRLKKNGVLPKLAVILVGNNPASEVYVQNKEKKARALGIEVLLARMKASAGEADVIALVEGFNRDTSVHGILVQLPLPAHMDANRVLSHISAQKDVDGLHTQNAGGLVTGRGGFIPCTPKGVLALVRESGINIEGKEAVIVGRSNLVGKPASILMLQNNATVTICHSKTVDLGKVTRRADILISAVGKPGLIGAGMVKEGAVVIDVGQCKVDGIWRGDVDFEKAGECAAYITPVPGGVGPMTIAMLMDNTVEAAERSNA